MKQVHIAEKQCQAPQIDCQAVVKRDNVLRRNSARQSKIECQFGLPSRVHSRARVFAPLRGRPGIGERRFDVRQAGGSRAKPSAACLPTRDVRSGLVSTFYEIDGERYPRVTAVCAIVANTQLAYWRGRVGNAEADRVSREATGLGTSLHKAVERLARGDGVIGMPDAAWPLFRAYQTWFEEHVRTVLGCEKLAVSRLHKYAGTVDLVAMLDDDEHPTVVDLKTSNNISETWGLQLAAYQLALQEEDIECARRVVVQIPSKESGAIYVHDLNDHDRDQRAFINALKLYRWRESRKPPEPQGPRIRFGGQR